jgi:hypothetical protein
MHLKFCTVNKKFKLSNFQELYINVNTAGAFTALRSKYFSEKKKYIQLHMVAQQMCIFDRKVINFSQDSVSLFVP